MRGRVEFIALIQLEVFQIALEHARLEVVEVGADHLRESNAQPTPCGGQRRVAMPQPAETETVQLRCASGAAR